MRCPTHPLHPSSFFPVSPLSHLVHPSVSLLPQEQQQAMAASQISSSSRRHRESAPLGRIRQSQSPADRSLQDLPE
uniref:Predicted protein n=1 Tax=Hordeum vulgare subsp. vulgare TaxID=112509 RepID=F2D7Y6_HORVV|nr:predicted protein [Hordeum vulgare subsp. vulgare]BAJ97998.1 predicted protein [Hordeum vulgare subsp. vulgare]